MPPVTGNLVPSLACVAVETWDSAAPFLLDDDIVAAGTARSSAGWIVVVAVLC